MSQEYRLWNANNKDATLARRMSTPSPSRAVLVVLAYLWLLAIIPLVAAKDDPEIQWHAKHGIVLIVAEFVLFGLLWVFVGIVSLMSLGAGCALGLLFVATWIAVVGVHLAAVIKGLNGGRLIVPWVSGYATRF
jgi:hypothetical protein